MTLTVTVVSARNLKDVQMVGTQDPYVVVKCLKTQMTTAVATDAGTEAQWNEQFKFKGLIPNVLFYKDIACLMCLSFSAGHNKDGLGSQSHEQERT